MQHDNNISNEYVYLYIHKFVWVNKEDGTKYDGHLKEGRVYKALVEGEGDMAIYKVELTPNKRSQGIALQSLVGKLDRWECDIQIINDEDLLHLDIIDEDMAMIANESSHLVDQATLSDEEKIELLFSKIHVSLNDAVAVDPEMFKVIGVSIIAICKTMIDKDYMPLTDHFALRDDDSGRVANMALAAYNLEQHLNSPTNNPSNLLNAMYVILTEIKRTIVI